MSGMSPPKPQRKHAQANPSSFMDSLTNAASRIPSLVHKGLTSLSTMAQSLKKDPFSDETFSTKLQSEMNSYNSNQRPYKQSGSILASVPGSYIKPMKPKGYGNRHDQDTAPSANIDRVPDENTDPAYETLEYFRNRPYVFAGRAGRTYFKEPTKFVTGTCNLTY